MIQDKLLNLLYSGPLAGTIESRFDARTLAMSGCILTTIGFLCCSFVNKFPILYVTYGVIGGEIQSSLLTKKVDIFDKTLDFSTFRLNFLTTLAYVLENKYQTV